MTRTIIFMALTTVTSHAYPIAVPPNPFAYDLGVKVRGAERDSAEITICCHGYGHSNEIVDVVESLHIFNHPLVGFNFPDYGITNSSDHTKVAYGTIQELLPLLSILKFYAIDQQIKKINLYGFSAGGGAVVNALAILNKHSYQDELAALGITPQTAHIIINAISNGVVILECPLKSMQEILDFRGASPGLMVIAANYAKNRLNPIDTVQALDGLALTILLHFENPDEILSNRDDALFIARLKKANGGITHVTTGNQGGHVGYHKELWDCYKRLRS